MTVCQQQDTPTVNYSCATKSANCLCKRLNLGSPVQRSRIPDLLAVRAIFSCHVVCPSPPLQSTISSSGLLLEHIQGLPHGHAICSHPHQPDPHYCFLELVQLLCLPNTPPPDTKAHGCLRGIGRVQMLEGS